MDLFAKNIYAENIHADHGSFTSLSASSTLADVGTFGKLCVGSVCVTEAEFVSVFGSRASQLAAAGAPGGGVATGAPADRPALAGADDMGTGTTTPGNAQNSSVSASLSLNGNNPAVWPIGAAWNDNLGALFTHNGQSETIYSTTTVDVRKTGTTTVDYWAVVPTSGRCSTRRVMEW